MNTTEAVPQRIHLPRLIIHLSVRWGLGVLFSVRWGLGIHLSVRWGLGVHLSVMFGTW